MSPLSDEAKKLYHNSAALLFAASALSATERQQFKTLGEMLGTHWDRDTIEAMFTATQPGKGKRQAPNEIVIPHLLGVNPKLQDYLRKRFGSSQGIRPPSWYKDVDRKEVVEGFDMDRHDFINLAGRLTPLIPKDYLKNMGYG